MLVGHGTEEEVQQHGVARQTLGLFADETPMMDFLKDIYQAHRIVTVRDWDHFGGARLFDAFQLDNASRKEFNEMIGAPYRPNFAQAAPVVALRPER